MILLIIIPLAAALLLAYAMPDLGNYDDDDDWE